MSAPSSPGFQMHSSFSVDSNPEYDPEYEYDAPKYTPLRKPGQSPAGVDEWFDKQQDTPYSERAYELEPLYDPNEELFTPEENYHTPDDSELFDENTPTPRPKQFQLQQEDGEEQSPSKSVSSVEGEDGEEDEEVLEMTKKFTGLKARPFTPMRPSTLFKSTTWADLMSSPENSPAHRSVIGGNNFGKPKAVTFVPTRSTKPLTVPVEFKFSQRTRTRAANENTDRNANAKVENKKPVSAKPSVTIPKPFKIHSTVQKMRQDQKKADRSPYVPLALRLKSFDKTPDRFKSTTKDQPVPQSKPVAAPKLTKPRSPKFMTDVRLKKEKKILSSEERIMEEIKSKSTFKANPIDTRILNSHGDFGVPRIKKSAPTIPHSPNLMKPKPKPVVVESQSSSSRIRSHPYLPPKKPFVPKIHHREIKPVDFKLPGDKISEMKRQKFVEDTKREEEAKKVQFKAKPVVNISAPLAAAHSRVMKPSMTLTEPHSPALITKLRGKQYQEEFEKKLQDEEIKSKQLAEFKAQPVPDLDVPFMPKHVDKPVTEPEEVVLNTEIRAEERKHFDMLMHEREEEMEMLKAMQDKEKEEQEREEILRLRKQAEFKAQKIMKAIPFEPKKSDKPLTEPVSPFIGEKRRLFKQ